MGQERERAETGAVADGVRRHGATPGQADVGVTEHGDEDGADEEGELHAAALRGARPGRGASAVVAVMVRNVASNNPYIPYV